MYNKCDIGDGSNKNNGALSINYHFCVFSVIDKFDEKTCYMHAGVR